MLPGLPGSPEQSVPVRSITALEEADALLLNGLSEWFDPFLVHFVRQALRAGGGVLVAGDRATPAGILIDDPPENVASIFTRSRPVAEALRDRVESRWVFSELPFEPRGETYRIYLTEEIPAESSHRFSHAIRVVPAAEMAPATRLLREAYGRFDERWLLAGPGGEETGFVAEVGGVVAGVGWASVVGAHGRLHSLFVSPRYRRLGIGTDLLFARLFWARRAGARRILSEIAETNLPSQAVASRGGMRPVGAIYLHSPRTGRDPPGSASSASLRRTDSS